MNSADETSLEHLFAGADRGDPASSSALYTALYSELHRVASRELGRHGWGVSLGRYKGIAKADSVLASNLAVSSGTVLDGMPRGVVKVPFVKNEYLAMAWGMPQEQTESVCNRLRFLNHPCEVMSPQAFEQFQRQALQEHTSKPQPAAGKSVKRKTRTAKANAAKARAARTAKTAKAVKAASTNGENAKGDR